MSTGLFPMLPARPGHPAAEQAFFPRFPPADRMPRRFKDPVFTRNTGYGGADEQTTPYLRPDTAFSLPCRLRRLFFVADEHTPAPGSARPPNRRIRRQPATLSQKHMARKEHRQAEKRRKRKRKWKPYHPAAPEYTAFLPHQGVSMHQGSSHPRTLPRGTDSPRAVSAV